MMPALVGEPLLDAAAARAMPRGIRRSISDLAGHVTDPAAWPPGGVPVGPAGRPIQRDALGRGRWRRLARRAGPRLKTCPEVTPALPPGSITWIGDLDEKGEHAARLGLSPRSWLRKKVASLPQTNERIDRV